MKKNLIRNLWLMIIAWCMFLNGHVTVSVLIALVSTAYALFRKGEVSYWRCMAVCTGFFAVMIGLYFTSSIPYFFPSLHIFMTVMMLNASVCNEYIWSMSRKQILPVLSLILMAFLAFTALVILVPESDYSLFGKGSLFLMVCFIFLPYLLPEIYCYVYKFVKHCLIMDASARKKAV